MDENSENFGSLSDNVKEWAVLSGEKITLPLNEKTRILYDDSYIGTKIDADYLELDMLEVLLLMERDRIRVKDKNNKEMTAADIIALATKRDKAFWQKYLVYRDLRKRGYIIRRGYGEGIDFRLFPRGSTRTKGSAKYFIVIIGEGNPVYFQYFDTITKQAIESRKELLLAIVDRLGDVTYYKLENMKFNENSLRKEVDL